MNYIYESFLIVYWCFVFVGLMFGIAFLYEPIKEILKAQEK